MAPHDPILSILFILFKFPLEDGTKGRHGHTGELHTATIFLNGQPLFLPLVRKNFPPLLFDETYLFFFIGHESPGYRNHLSTSHATSSLLSSLPSSLSILSSSPFFLPCTCIPFPFYLWQTIESAGYNSVRRGKGRREKQQERRCH